MDEGGKEEIVSTEVSFKEQVAKRIKEVRLQLDLSVSEMSAILGKGVPAIYAIEQGRVFPQLDDLAKLQVRFGLNVNWIISGTGQPLPQDVKKRCSPTDLIDLISTLRENPGNEELAQDIHRRLTATVSELQRLNKVRKIVQETN